MNALRESRKPSVAGEMPRRDFLKLSVAASGGLLIGFYLPGMQPEAQGATFAPNAFVRIGTDDSVTVIVNQLGDGSGSLYRAADDSGGRARRRLDKGAL